jgi:endo-1,4-beta-mannosidase
MGNTKQSNAHRQHSLFRGASNRKMLITLYSMLIGFTSLVATPNTGTAEPSARIGVRPGMTTGEFYSNKEGRKQVVEPSGNSWVILHEEADEDKHHANFSPEAYSSVETEQVLTKMEQSGYNVIRVFIFKGHFRCTEITTVGGDTRDTTGELNEPYMTNFLDFMERARNHNLHVQVVLDGWPWTKYYRDIALTDLPDIEGNNREKMTPGSIAAKTEYLERFVRAIKAAGLETTIFSYEISNEPCSWTNAKPFSVTTGTFETAAGTYDMSSAASRQACADDNLILALSTWSDAIKRIDSDALVSVGIFSYAAVGKAGMANNGLLPIGTKDVRWPGRMKEVVSVTDFGSLHMYIQSTGTTVAEHMESQEWSLIPNKHMKPFMSGEFGAHRDAYRDGKAAAAALYGWRKDMLDAGFAGALLFTWDTLNHTRWTAVEDGEAVNQALKPGGSH